jgi:hypothetical protein
MYYRNDAVLRKFKRSNFYALERKFTLSVTEKYVHAQYANITNVHNY